jgi:hypothetical protein
MAELVTMDHVVAALEQIGNRADEVDTIHATAADEHSAQRQAAALAAELADDGES